ncbi:MAG: tetratricopeptide repeat protein, partial [Gemmatimonadetes bacterium]|nr:tetratricopeptide repeat protein [Gemmatimonadota bacterium]
MRFLILPLPGALLLGALVLPCMVPDAGAVLSKTEMARAVRGAAETGDTAAVDSLISLYPTYSPDVVALLHRFAFDDTAGAPGPYRAAAALTAERARAGGDSLPARVHATITAFDEHALASWRDAERLYLAGVRALQGLAYDDADTALDSAITLYRAIGERYRLGLAVSYRGLSALNRGLFDEAEAFLIEASGIQQQTGDAYNRAATLAYRAQILEFLGRYGDALAQYEESLALFRSRRAHQDIAETLHSIANVMTTRGDFRGADDQLALSEALYDTLGNAVGLALTQIARGDLARRFGEFEAAEKRYESAEREIRENDLEPLAGTLWIARGILLQMLGDHRTAARYYEEAISSERAIGDTLSVLLATLNRARALLEAGERNRAAEIAEGVLGDVDARPYPSIQRLASETLGDYSVRTNDLKRAVISFERALENARASGESEAEADNRMALALVHQKMGATDASIEGLEQALALFKEMGHLPAVLETKLELADALRLAGDYDRARSEARETLETARFYDDWITQSKALFSIASIDYEAGRLEESGARLRGLDSLEYASQL